jgi:AcrR family transcriptional regulator
VPADAAAPTPLRRDARENRERILAAARECFAAEGVDVPVEEIAHRAGVGMGTLYRRFPTKDDLIDAVLAEALDAYTRTAQRFLAEDDPWAGFCGFLERALELHAENLALKDVLASGDHGAEGVEMARERLRPIVARLISRAQEAGALRADFSPRDMPIVFWTAGRVIEATAGVAPELWRRYLALLLDGLRADCATPLPHRALTAPQLARLRAGRRR